jgi:hypothetical protein
MKHYSFLPYQEVEVDSRLAKAELGDSVYAVDSVVAVVVAVDVADHHP